MPLLQMSAYRTKKPSRASGCTIVLNFVFSPASRCSFDLPFVARIITGSGFEGVISERVFSGSSEDVSWSYVRRFCVRNIEPWLDLAVAWRRDVRDVKNYVRD
jgi:hypothetical protein